MAGGGMLRVSVCWRSWLFYVMLLAVDLRERSYMHHLLSGKVASCIHSPRWRGGNARLSAHRVCVLWNMSCTCLAIVVMCVSGLNLRACYNLTCEKSSCIVVCTSTSCYMLDLGADVIFIMLLLLVSAQKLSSIYTVCLGQCDLILILHGAQILLYRFID